MINVTKNNGKLEPFNAEKINEMLEFVCEGTEASASAIAMRAHLSLFEGIPTSVIQKELIDSARDLATVDAPDYLIAAGRLMMSALRKEVYGQFEPLPLYDHIQENIELGVYDKSILEEYTKEEIEFLESHIVHERDMFIPQAAALTYKEKYLIKNKVTDKVYETPQVALMLIPMCLLSKRPNRLERIVKFYEAVSTNKISLPSPIMAGVRSPTRQFSSCCLIDSDDNLDAINATGNAIVKYASKRAGIGINGGRIRAVKSPVRGGEISHTGVINFYKKWQADLHSTNQGGLRSSAATLHYPWWHKEIEDLLVLKNNKGIETNRARHLDYSFQMNRLFMERVKANKEVALFSPHVSSELYESFFSDQDKFDELYHKLEADVMVPRKTVKALDLFSLFAMERAATGRIYAMFVDNVNIYGSFNEQTSPVYMSNLCVSGDTEVVCRFDCGQGVINIPMFIKDIGELLKELGDKNLEVLSFNEAEGKKEWKVITDWGLTKYSAKVMKITDSESGNSIVCTPCHLVYTSNRGYVEAGKLVPEDKLVLV